MAAVGLFLDVGKKTYTVPVPNVICLFVRLWIFRIWTQLLLLRIYNINMQIQEDKVENLAYFMRFAQAALSKAAADMERQGRVRRLVPLS